VIGAAIAEVVVLDSVLTTLMPAFSQISSSGTTPGSALNTGSLERKDRILTLPSVTNGTRRLSSVTTFLTSSGCCLAKNIGHVAAVGMPDQGQVTIIGVGIMFFSSSMANNNVEGAAAVMHAPADIFLAGLGDHRSVGFEIVLDADDEIAAGGKKVREGRNTRCA